MRDISAELLAAARSLRGVPVVSLDVHDRRDRWQAHFDTGQASHRCDQACIYNTWILRLRSLNGAQGLQAATVYDPEAPEHWPGSWYDLHQRCELGSDVALGVVGSKLTSKRARAYCFWQDGADKTIQCAESTNGYSFGVPETVCDGINLEGWLAADHAAVFYHADNSLVKVWQKPAVGGAWTLSTYDALGALGSSYGLAVWYLEGAQLYYLLVAADGRLYAGGWNPSSDTWFPPQQLAPGGSGAAGSGVVLREPSLLRAYSRWYATWVESVAQGPGWQQAVASSATSWPHFGNDIALEVGGSGGSPRAALAYRPFHYHLFACDETSGVHRIDYAEENASQNIAGLKVGAYTRRTVEDGSRLTVWVDNRDGSWSDWGQADAVGEALRPHATLALQRGYRTANGHELVTLDPHYLVNISEEGGSHEGWLRLEAVDGWGLLRYWRAAEPLTWEERTIGWLLEHLAARVGLGYAALGGGALDQTLSRFTVLPGQSAADAVATLLRLAGCGARWSVAGTLRVGTWDALVGETAALGESDELLWARRQQSAPVATSWLVYGEGVMGREENAAASMALGLRARITRVESRADTQALGDAVADGWRTRGDASGWTLRAKVPLRPDLELWDAVAVVGWSGTWRVRGLAERYDARRGLYVTEVTAEG
ncbi:MAG: hypothetical protein ACP5G7_06450 [Anaerolineae bacterium]